MCEASRQVMRSITFADPIDLGSIVPDVQVQVQVKIKYYAGVAELADALDLGSSVPDVQVQVLSPAPKIPRWLCVISVFFVVTNLMQILSISQKWIVLRSNNYSMYMDNLFLYS